MVDITKSISRNPSKKRSVSAIAVQTFHSQYFAEAFFLRKTFPLFCVCVLRILSSTAVSPRHN